MPSLLRGAEGSEGAPGADQTTRAIPHARFAATCYPGPEIAAMMREMPKLYFEDFKPGSTMEYGPRLVTREEIVAFAAEFDPQPMHLDEEAGRAGLLGGLAASGWHTCCLMMRLAADGFILNSASMGAPGVDEVRWLAPLRPGRSITLRTTTLETRPSASRPEMGFVKMLFEVVDDAGVTVMALNSSLIMGRRETTA